MLQAESFDRELNCSLSGNFSPFLATFVLYASTFSLFLVTGLCWDKRTHAILQLNGDIIESGHFLTISNLLAICNMCLLKVKCKCESGDWILHFSLHARDRYLQYHGSRIPLNQIKFNIFIMQLCKNYANLKHYIGQKFNVKVIKATHRRSK